MIKRLAALVFLFASLNPLVTPSWSHADPPPKLLYYGGPVLSHVKVYVVLWGNGFNPLFQGQLGGFYTAIVNSNYFDWLKEYNTPTQTVGRGSFDGVIAITPTHTAMDLTDDDIEAELEHQLDLHVLPEPDADTLFMIYFPEDYSITKNGLVSCESFCAYHEGFVSKTHGNVFYGVMPDLGGACSMGCGFNGDEFENLTDVSSHELTEAVTDPFPAIGFNPAFPQAWIAPDQNEIGDLCAQTGTELTAPQGQIYVVQEEYDNTTSSCAPGPYQSP
jgi:hypothetical protein